MTFDTAFERTVGLEGGYVNDPNDPGGETNWGISKRAYPKLAIKHLTRDDAKEIYRRDFWQRIHADKLPDAVVFQVFDFALNSGVETAVRYLQRALHVADDGYWGPVSQAAADRTSASDMIMGLCAERLDYMTRLSNWGVASKGWVRRVAHDLRYGVIDA